MICCEKKFGLVPLKHIRSVVKVVPIDEPLYLWKVRLTKK